MEDIATNGFDSTIVMTRTMGDYQCLWTRKVLKEKLNQFVARHEEKLNSHTNYILAQKAQNQQDIPEGSIELTTDQ